MGEGRECWTGTKVYFCLRLSVGGTGWALRCSAWTNPPPQLWVRRREIQWSWWVSWSETISVYNSNEMQNKLCRSEINEIIFSVSFGLSNETKSLRGLGRWVRPLCSIHSDKITIVICLSLDSVNKERIEWTVYLCWLWHSFTTKWPLLRARRQLRNLFAEKDF